MGLLKNVWKTDEYIWNLLTDDLERNFLEEVLDIDLMSPSVVIFDVPLVYI